MSSTMDELDSGYDTSSQKDSVQSQDLVSETDQEQGQETGGESEKEQDPEPVPQQPKKKLCKRCAALDGSTKLILSAIRGVRSKKGITSGRIISYLDYGLSLPPHKIKIQVHNVLRRGVQDGYLQKYRNTYRLTTGDEFDEPLLPREKVEYDEAGNINTNLDDSVKDASSIGGSVTTEADTDIAGSVNDDDYDFDSPEVKQNAQRNTKSSGRVRKSRPRTRAVTKTSTRKRSAKKGPLPVKSAKGYARKRSSKAHGRDCED